MRSLARIARECDAGVLLLAHVDKGTSRGDRGPNSEGYSGSTAWNNSARSRLFMSRDKDGSLLLEHQKHNLGRLREPLRLVWPEGGIPQADKPFGPVVQGIADRGHAKALLRLIAEFTARGEFITTATTSLRRLRALRQLPMSPHRPHQPQALRRLRRLRRQGVWGNPRRRKLPQSRPQGAQMAADLFGLEQAPLRILDRKDCREVLRELQQRQEETA